eukprot:11222493-Alexandrium_andersonii.AAC.1
MVVSATQALVDRRQEVFGRGSIAWLEARVNRYLDDIEIDLGSSPTAVRPRMPAARLAAAQRVGRHVQRCHEVARLGDPVSHQP